MGQEEGMASAPTALCARAARTNAWNEESERSVDKKDR